MKTNINDTLILTYGLSNKQMEILKDEFDNVKDVSDNFLELIESPAAAVVVNWDKLNDDEVKVFQEACRQEKIEYNTLVLTLNDHDEDNIEVYHQTETKNDTLSDIINEIKERLSLPEQFKDAKCRMEIALGDIRKAIEDPTKNIKHFESQVLMINNGCRSYEYLTTIMNHLPELRGLEKVPYRIELNCVLNATMVALGLLKIEDIDMQQDLSLYREHDLALNYIADLAEMIKSHYKSNLKKNHAI